MRMYAVDGRERMVSCYQRALCSSRRSHAELLRGLPLEARSVRHACGAVAAVWKTTLPGQQHASNTLEELNSERAIHEHTARQPPTAPRTAYDALHLFGHTAPSMQRVSCLTRGVSLHES